MTNIAEPPAGDLAQAKHLYESGAASIAATAALLGLTESALRWRARKWGWTRKPRGKNAQGKSTRGKNARGKSARAPAAGKATTAPASPAAMAPAPRPADTQTLIGAVRHVLEAEIASLRARSGEPDAADANARTLNSLARTLSVLRGLENEKDGGHADDENAGPLDLAELRRELARRIDLLRQQRAVADPS